MIDCNSYVYNLLSSASTVSVVYERFREKVPSPCISYIEINNASYMLADNQEISRVLYQVKVWGNTADECGSICSTVDNAMRNGGFQRTLAQTLVEPTTNQIYKVLQYEALAREVFGEDEETPQQITNGG